MKLDLSLATTDPQEALKIATEFAKLLTLSGSRPKTITKPNANPKHDDGAQPQHV